MAQGEPKMSKLTISISAVSLLCGLLLTCESEKPDQDIDPCPGWSAFKVGHEWIYSFVYVPGCSPAPDDTCELIMKADSIISYENKDYLYLNFTGPNGYDGYFRIRCNGDTCWGLFPFSKPWLHQDNISGEYIIWNLGMQEGDTLEYYFGEFPAAYMKCSGHKSIIFNNKSLDVSLFYFSAIPWTAVSYDTWQQVNKKLGIFRFDERLEGPIIWTLKSINF
jgi:hypothetical protein